MDYNFILSEKKGFSKVKRRMFVNFIPVFFLAAILPFLTAFVLSPNTLNFLTRADERAELRIWLEPSSVVSQVSQEVELAVIASFDHKTKLAPSLEFSLAGEGSVTIAPTSLNYETPFKGRAQVGVVKATSKSMGERRVVIVKDSVTVKLFDEPIDVFTGSSTIVFE